MKLNELINATKKPALYEKGSAVMWTDEHIAQYLLQAHLNPEIDAASRTPESISKAIELILNTIGDESKEILDLGCGPGLYTEILAGLGHRVTGVDFSANSIRYAKEQAMDKGLAIEYCNMNYLDLDFENRYDLVMLIFTDLGVLLPEERVKVLENIYRALKPGGIVIFDLLNDTNIEEKIMPRSWEAEAEGFWKNSPYVALSQGFHYPENKVMLSQHIVLDTEAGSFKTYHFWTHYFNAAEVKTLLSAKGFVDVEVHKNVLPATNIWNGENVLFYKAVKG